MNEPLRFRPRIMSEKIMENEEMHLPDVRRKNTEMMMEPQRKNSQISNISNMSNYN